MAQYDVTLRDYWRIVRKRKLYIIFATFMLGLTSFATAYMSRPEPRYRTEAKVQYNRSQTAQEAYAAALSGSDPMATQQAVIQSYEVVERTAHRLGYVDTTTASEEERIRAILNLRPFIQTSAEGLTNIISISVTNANRFTARDIANVAAEEYKQYNYEVRNSRMLKYRELIQSRRDSVTVRLKRAQDELKHFQEETQIVSIQATTSAVLTGLNSVRARYDALLSLRTSIDNLLADRTRVDESSLQTFPPEEGGSRFAELLRELQILNQDRNRLLVNYTELHPEVRKVDDRKQVVIQQMLNSLGIQRDVLSRRIDNQRAEMEALDTRFRQLPDMGIQLESLTRNVAIQSELLNAIEQEYQRSQLSEAEEVREVTILQRALLPSTPINPSSPNTFAGVGAMLGLIIGVVAAFIAETLDTSIGTIEDVEEYLGVPVVGIIPQMDIEGMRESIEARTGGPIDLEMLEKRMRLSAHFEPQSTLAESYRALRTNIQFANLEKGAKVISITSASHQEGKSTTVANLAITLAQAGNRVLLVDGDLRRPTIARLFGLDREPGLTDVILGNYTWREVVRTVTDIMVGGLGMDDIMMTAGMDNLNILTSGVLPPNPAEITDARRMTEFIQEVKEAYDVVLIDSPPVLQATDATVLGTKVDGVLMVYKIGNISRSALRRAKQQLDNVGVTTLGVIINGLRADISEDFKDLRYYSYYTYGSKSEEDTGPYLTRLYNRSKRQLESARKSTLTQILPLFDLVKTRLPQRFFNRAEVVEEGIEPEEAEERDLSAKILTVFFWIFLMFFLSAGLLWQLGYLSPAMIAPHAPPHPVPALPAPPTVPPGQTEEQPTGTTGTHQQEAPLPKKVSAVPDATPAQVIAAPSPLPKTPSVRPVSAQTVQPTANLRQYGIHMSSHKVRISAQEEAGYYEKRGYAVCIVPIHIEGRGLFYRLLIGQYPDRQTALKAAAKLQKKSGKRHTTVLPLPTTPPADQSQIAAQGDAADPPMSGITALSPHAN